MRVARTRVKVCGITSPGDAAEAVRAGVDALGVVFAESSRQISIADAKKILADVPPFVNRIGVFVDAPEEFVERAVAQLGLCAVQFHGTESPERCAAAPAPVIKSFRVGAQFDIAAIEPYRGHLAAVLLDTYDPQVDGGTGKTFAWNALAELPDWALIVLAGGLNPVNVGTAIDSLHPFAVDVSSGVEERVRQKDRARLHAFVAAVCAADENGAL